MPVLNTLSSGAFTTALNFVSPGKKLLRGIGKYFRGFKSKTANDKSIPINSENTKQIGVRLQTQVVEQTAWYRSIVGKFLQYNVNRYPRLANALKKLRRCGEGTVMAFIGIQASRSDEILSYENRRYEDVCAEIRGVVSKSAPCKGPILEFAEQNLADFKFGNMIAKGCNAVVYELEDERGSEKLAMKMMFNYDIESKADNIMSALSKEIVPLTVNYPRVEAFDCNLKRPVHHQRQLAAHPNIVSVYNTFVDKVPLLPDAPQTYPCALPPALHAGGFGRNSTLFILMKRYDCTLREYLLTHPVPWNHALILYIQLLEALACLQQAGVAHRDIKSDNIFIDTSVSPPMLVLGDFGSCLAAEDGNLVTWYNNSDVNKGGNPCLMAPEILEAKAGFLGNLDYRKADIWAAGSIAYEMFGLTNPFYEYPGKPALYSRTYSEDDLPALPDDVPALVQNVIHNTLRRDKYLRCSATTAANQLQAWLHMPVTWVRRLARHQPPCHAEIADWLVTMTAETVCLNAAGARSADACLKTAFLSRVDVTELVCDIQALF